MIDIRTFDISSIAVIPAWLIELLNPSDRKEISLILDPRNRRRLVWGRALLRIMLSRVLGGHPGSWEFLKDGKGKSRIANRVVMPSFDFSVSYSGNGVVVAVSDQGPVGVDVERVEGAKHIDIEAFLTPSEEAYLKSLHPLQRHAETIRLWTMKEAYAKMLGLGFSAEFSEISIREIASSSAKVLIRTQELSISGKQFRLAYAGQGIARILMLSQKDFETETIARGPYAVPSSVL